MKSKNLRSCIIITFGLLTLICISSTSSIIAHGYGISSFTSIAREQPSFDNHLYTTAEDYNKYIFNKISSSNISNTVNSSDNDLQSNSTTNNKNNSSESNLKPDTSAIEGLRY